MARVRSIQIGKYRMASVALSAFGHGVTEIKSPLTPKPRKKLNLALVSTILSPKFAKNATIIKF